jgi:Polyketide cyclase / dehydrase and lipid transport
MGSIRKEITLGRTADAVWDAVRDYGAPHKRLAPGVLTDSRIDGDTRIVTFANGLELRERIVVVDDVQRRLVWAVVGGRLEHHNGAMQVFADNGTCRLVWTTDFLPDDHASEIGGLMEMALQAVRRTLG